MVVALKLNYFNGYQITHVNVSAPHVCSCQSDASEQHLATFECDFCSVDLEIVRQNKQQVCSNLPADVGLQEWEAPRVQTGMKE